MTAAAVIAALLILLAGGMGATVLLMRGNARINLIESAALGSLFGSGLTSLLLWSGGLVISGAFLQMAVTVVLLGFAVTGYRSLRRRRAVLAFPKPRNLLEWSLAAVIALEMLAMIYGALGHGLGWDGLLNWEVKARYALLNDGVLPAAYFSSGTRAFTHPSYPLLIPMTELWFYLWIGEPHQFWIKLIFPLYYAAGAILLCVVGKRMTDRRWPGLVAAALLFFVPFLTNTPGNATGGYVDFPISVLYLATIGYLLLFAQQGGDNTLRLFAASLALLPWAKREGAILWLIATVCGAVVMWRAGRSWRAFLWLAPGAFILASWKIFLRAMHATDVSEFVPMTAATVHANAGRLSVIARFVVAEMRETERWSIFWPSVAVALVYLAWRARNDRLLLLFVAIVSPLVLYAVTFVFSGWPDYRLHFLASFSRLVCHVMPVGWLAIVAAMPTSARAPETAPDL